MNEINAKITKSSSVLIKAVKDDSLTGELFAVNWFDTKLEWLYNLYNSLASRSVLKVGGAPLFKGKVSEDLSSNKGRRNIVLIVKYPNGSAFKKLLESSYFKIVSLLRMKAVDRFTFSFTRAAIAPNFENEMEHYMLHYFDFNIDLDLVVESLFKWKKEVKILYAGTSFAHLYQETRGQQTQQVPAIIEQLIILGADSKEVFSELYNSSEYQSLFENEASGYSAILKRIF